MREEEEGHKNIDKFIILREGVYDFVLGFGHA
jgi:hypothetical protein